MIQAILHRARTTAGRRNGLLLFTTLFMMTAAGCQNEGHSQEDGNSQAKASYFEIETNLGSMVIRLYDETPGHRDNFRKLVSEGFYDGTTFHRVIPQFMIQGGDPNSKDDDPLNDGMGGPGYTQPAEFNEKLYHKRGALAAARTGGPMNPGKESSGSQFYIVVGRTVENAWLDQLENHQRQNLSPDYRVQPEARKAYTTVGGAPNLDMDYTVFGELVDGFDVLDQIVNVDTPARLGQAPGTDRPIENVTMTVRPLPDYTPPASPDGN